MRMGQMSDSLWDGKFLARFVPAILAILPFAIMASVTYSSSTANDREQTLKIVMLEERVKELDKRQLVDNQAMSEIKSDMRVMRFTLERIEKALEPKK